MKIMFMKHLKSNEQIIVITYPTILEFNYEIQIILKTHMNHNQLQLLRNGIEITVSTLYHIYPYMKV